MRVIRALLALGMAMSQADGGGSPMQTPVFAHEGKDWYRIPSVVVSTKGVVLAFASRRKGSVGDFGHETDVVLRRSLDGGKTWLPMQTLVTRPDTDVHHGPAVVHRRSRAILKFCRYWPAKGNPHRFVSSTPYAKMRELGYLDHIVESRDEGKTWSAPHPVPLDFPGGAVSAATGNGSHGIQLRDGRLLIQGGYVLDGKRHSCVMVSADGGGTWRLGGSAAVGGSIREFGMAQLADGSIYLNVRTKVGYRAVGRSRDRGETFDAFTLNRVLVDSNCHAGLIALPPAKAGEPVRLVFSNPANRFEGEGLGRYRNKLTLRLSPDEGKTWPVARVLAPGHAAYSDLTVMSDGSLGCLYEGGDHSPYERIVFARLALDWLANRSE